MTFYYLLKSMRPHQWTKNGLLFAGVLFSFHFMEPMLLLRAALGCALFCLISGSIYIINDICDLEKDRLHPRKRNRPLPSGKVSPYTAGLFALLVGPGAILAGFLINVPFGWTALTYFIFTVLYSLWLKNKVIADIMLLAMGFVLRAIAGVVIIRVEGVDVPLTPWFLICVFFLALFIAICKRRHELLYIDSASKHRAVLSKYSPEFLDQMISVCTSATIFAYTLYLITVFGIISDANSLKMLTTLPFVVYGIFRYLYLIYRKAKGGEPERLVLSDRPLFLNTMVWLCLIIVLQKWL